MSEYKHPQIPPIDTNSIYLKRNQESFARFLSIYEGQIAYTSDDYPVLINCMERLYKGICQELQNIYPEKIHLTPFDYKTGHHFIGFMQHIDKIIPIAEDYETKNKAYDFATDIQQRYNGARFEDAYSKTDFDTLFRRYERQTYRLYKGLDKIKTQIKEEELDTDIDKW